MEGPIFDFSQGDAIGCQKLNIIYLMGQMGIWDQ
jgi:hypothetical protein